MPISGKKIISELEKGTISVLPYERDLINPNSIDIRLGPSIRWYRHAGVPPGADDDPPKRRHLLVVDPYDDHASHMIEVKIAESGYVIRPGRLYLAHTLEHVASDKYQANLNGKSSLARLGLDVHSTAGFGDVGFSGQWTLELWLKSEYSLRLYAGMPIGQLEFETVKGKKELYSGRYQEQEGATASRYGKERSKPFSKKE